MIAWQLIGGFILLVVGAEGLVRGASKIAASLGIPPLIIGLTIVALGTSAPEIAVSVASGLNGQGNLALGNVIGSNIFNVLFILGISSLLAPLVVDRQLIRLDVPVMVGTAFLTLVLAWDGMLSLWDGIILLVILVGYIGFLIFEALTNKKVVESEDYAKGFPPMLENKPLYYLLNIAILGVGLWLLVLGAGYLVEGAVALAKLFGVSDLVIGLTIVAVGTSLPEVATSIVATLRGQRDIAVGNVVGSNIFNVLAVLGVVGVISPQGIPVSEAILRFDLLIMAGVSVLCLPVFFTRLTIRRWEGALFLTCYLLYVGYLIVDSSGQLPQWSWFFNGVTYGFIPLVVLFMIYQVVRHWGKAA